MNQHKLFLFFVIAVLLVGCGGGKTPVPTAVSPEVTATAVPSLTPSLTQPPMLTATSMPAFPPETRLKEQCLEILPEFPRDFAPSSIVILGGGVGVKQRRFETLLLDMATGQTTEIITQDQFQGDHIVSLDRKLMAYSSHIFDSEGKPVKDELVVSTANGQILRTIPWEEKWLGLLAWKDNQSLILSYNEPVFSASGEQETYISYLVLNPFNDERQILRTDFPNFVLTYVPTISWDGWHGVSFDPTLNLAVYPSYVADGDEMYTYSIWDISKQERVASLENIFTAYFDIFPMPRWSPDGSQFVFVGLMYVSNPGVFELYRVKADGQTEQLTNLSSVAFIRPDTYVWSPDNRHVTMYISSPADRHSKLARLAVLDTENLEVIDYCITVNLASPGLPIWSPDGKQFVVVDWSREDNPRVILIDIEKGIAVQIAENMNILSWMASP